MILPPGTSNDIAGTDRKTKAGPGLPFCKHLLASAKEIASSILRKQVENLLGTYLESGKDRKRQPGLAAKPGVNGRIAA